MANIRARNGAPRPPIVANQPGGADARPGGADTQHRGADSQPQRPSHANKQLESNLGPSWEVTQTRLGRDGRARRAMTPRGAAYGRGHVAIDTTTALAVFATLAAANRSMSIAPAFAFASTITEFDDDLQSLLHDASSPVSGESWDILGSAMASTGNVIITAEMGGLKVPKSFRQAMHSPQRDYWRDAIAKELGGLLALHTWDMVLASTMPRGSNLMHCHYVFTVKRKADGSIEKFKARLVADGNTQKHGVDFDRIFATVVKTTTVRLVLVIAAARDYNLSSIDVRQAYLQAELKEDLYMRPPPDVHAFDSRGRPLVCKLRRSLYGLKQAGREWAILLTSFLLSWGFTRSTIDPCLYTFCETHHVDGRSEEHILWVLIYVDDGLIVDNHAALRDRFVSDLSKRFPTEDKGELAWMLNVSITRDRSSRTLTMSQELYVSDLLSKYGSFAEEGTTRHFDCPMEAGVHLTSADQPAVGSAEHQEMATRRDAYMSIVGGLLWLANMTMWHLAYPAGQLARFLTNPGPSHFRAAVRVLAYLRSGGARPLVFAPTTTRGLDTYVDSDWAVRFSVSGCLVFYHGCLFHWFSKMQKSVSLSSAEAEYFGAMMASRDLMWLRDLFVELSIRFSGASIIWSDSKSAVDMAFDPVAFKQTKHIMRAAEFLRDLVAREVITLRHVPGRTMLADLLTKAVERAIFLQLLRLFDRYASDGIVCPA